jgi:hypothetical protein
MSGELRDTDKIAGWLSQAWFEDLCNRLRPLHILGEDYEVADDEQYKALGEADKDGLPAADAPLILFRKSDGRFFEVELDATVWETTVEERQAQRARLIKMRDRARERGLIPEPPEGGKPRTVDMTAELAEDSKEAP